MIRRAVLAALAAHLANPEISLIIGPRQAGKTTLMRLLMDKIIAKGQRAVFLNYDLDRDRPFFKTQETLLAKIKLGIGPSGYVFLDEIQGKENAGLFLKGLFDLNLPYKFVVSGSGSLDLKEKIVESLAGRKRTFTVYPLNFWEFLDFKTDYKYERRLENFLQVEKTSGEKLLTEYLSFGGYPKVVLAQTLEEKSAAIAEIYESYVAKDLISLLRLKETENFAHLLRLLANQKGQILKYQTLATTLGITEKTSKRYLWYLEKTFIGDRLPPFTRRLAKEIVKSPVFYFADTGLANYATNDFFQQDLSLLGFSFQNMIYSHLNALVQKGAGSLHYWRTKDGTEVDFVIDLGKTIVPVEVKLQTFDRPKVPSGLISFIVKYHPPTAYVINLDFQGNTRVEDTEVVFLPYYDLSKVLN